MARYASSTDVARLAGVSQSAVSRTYKPGASVSEETRRKVLAAAEELGYRPSLIPQIMLNHRSYLVAIVIGGMYNPFYARVLEEFTTAPAGDRPPGAAGACRQRPYLRRRDPAARQLPGRRHRQRAGDPLAQAADELARLRIPVITFNSPVKNEWVSSVSCDNEGAARALADLLIARGGTRFAYVTGPLKSPANEERLRGYRDRLRERGVADLRVETADFRYEAGHAAALALFADRRSGPDAIFCANDLLALGAMDALRRTLGVRVPEDVLVAGFDDIPAASWLAYDLTTFVQDAPRMVEAALGIVSAAAGHAPEGYIRIVIPAALVERGSTRRG